MATSTSVNTFRSVLNLYDYDVGPAYFGTEKVRGLRDLHGDCLPNLKTIGKMDMFSNSRLSYFWGRFASYKVLFVKVLKVSRGRCVFF